MAKIYKCALLFVLIGILATAYSKNNSKNAKTFTINVQAVTAGPNTMTATTTETTFRSFAHVAPTPTWIFSDSNGTCILLSGKFSFAITYEKANGQNNVAKIPIPETATVSGICSHNIALLNLVWQTLGTSEQQTNNITFLFRKSGFETGVETFYSLNSIFGRIFCNSDPNNSSTTSPVEYNISVDLANAGMTAPLGKSYECQSYKAVPVYKMESVEMEMSGVWLEAFHHGITNEFGDDGWTMNSECTFISETSQCQ